MDCIQLSLFGKRTRSIQFQRRRRLQSRAGRTCPRGTAKRFNSSTSGRGADGAKPEQSPETDGLWLGDSLTLNIGESPTPKENRACRRFWRSTCRRNTFERTSLSGNPDSCVKAWKEVAGLAKTALLEMIEWWQRGGGTQPIP